MLFAATPAYASWSSFAYVAPETADQYGLELEFSPVESPKGVYRIKFKAIAYPNKQAWLIVTDSALSKKEMELRHFILWGTPPAKEVLIKAQLIPVANKSTKGEPLKYYEVELSEAMLQQAYIYIDFPLLVLDGGYYYTIDLAAFLSDYQNNLTRKLLKTH